MQQEAMQRMPVDLGTLPHQDRTIPPMIRPIPRPKLGTVVRQTDIQTIPCAHLGQRAQGNRLPVRINGTRRRCEAQYTRSMG